LGRPEPADGSQPTEAGWGLAMGEASDLARGEEKGGALLVDMVPDTADAVDAH